MHAHQVLVMDTHVDHCDIISFISLSAVYISAATSTLSDFWLSPGDIIGVTDE